MMVEFLDRIDTVSAETAINTRDILLVLENLQNISDLKAMQILETLQSINQRLEIGLSLKKYSQQENPLGARTAILLNIPFAYKGWGWPMFEPKPRSWIEIETVVTADVAGRVEFHTHCSGYLSLGADGTVHKDFDETSRIARVSSTQDYDFLESELVKIVAPLVLQGQAAKLLAIGVVKKELLKSAGRLMLFILAMGSAWKLKLL